MNFIIMAKIELLMPKMGESIIEATILKWVKKPGDKVELDETILEIATDKVDSDIPSPVQGIISEVLYPENAVVKVGEVIAIITTEGEESPKASPSVAEPIQVVTAAQPPNAASFIMTDIPNQILSSGEVTPDYGDRFYSPLVKNIAKQENISDQELASISGSGANGRVTKQDILQYVAHRNDTDTVTILKSPIQIEKPVSSEKATTFSGKSEIVEMDRMRKMIADHMVKSKQVSAHVTSFVESDVTGMVKWREKNKIAFEQKYGTKITFTPLFVDAVVNAIKDYPMVNISLDGQNIIIKKDINIGLAAALPNGNLIVPVIKNADFLNLPGLAKATNDLVARARINKLKPEEIQDGTFTITNVGTFGNLMGTPIINQPQVAILATGAIVKKPAVLETAEGDVIAIRHMMFLSLSYDHRIVDGALGGAFLKRISDYLENFDSNTPI
ncbi:MAG: dihydrolipoamide acetyltransferase family protein [Saprospiraceae bacterium]